MNGVEEDGWIGIKDMLGAVPVGNIEIDDAGALDVPLQLEVSCGYGDVVDIA